jgi:Polyketide cyclase / dehydrase and lipid transport
VLNRTLTTSLTLRARGPVAAATAWERYDRLDLWPTWSPQLHRVEVDPEPGPGQSHRRLSSGLSGRSGRVFGPFGLRADFTVLTVDPARMRWTWRVHRGPIVIHLDHEVVPRPEGSETVLTLRGPAPVIVGYAPLARYALHRLVTLPGGPPAPAD